VTTLSDLTGLASATGSWTGTNGFRLMPFDELAERPASLGVQIGARGNLASVAYRWEHPSDGSQEGLLIVGLSSEEGQLTSLWSDSWHQQPTSMSLTGAVTPGGSIALEGSYGEGWAWRITVEAPGDGQLHLRMDNVIPESQATDEIRAGAYPVMIMDLQPSVANPPL
jgi:hypothetical protein